MNKPLHFNILHKLFVDDDNPSDNWRRLTLGVKNRHRWSNIRNYVLSTIDSHQYGEFIYLLMNNWNLPCCPICGGTLKYNHGYKTYCSHKCARAAQHTEDKSSITRQMHRKQSDKNITIDVNDLQKYDSEYLPLLFDGENYTTYLSSMKTSNEHADIRYWLNNRISWATTWAETLYCVHHKIIEQPVCNVCGKILRFKNIYDGYVSHKHKIKHKHIKSKQQSPRKHVLSDEGRKRLSDYRKKLWENKEYRENTIRQMKAAQANLSDEKRNAKLNGYHKWWNGLDDNAKEQHNHNISNSVRKWSKTLSAEQKQEKLRKEYNTKKQNNTFNTSEYEEEELYEYIKTLFPDVIHQYKSTSYPYKCDFYIPSIDTYIEYQGSWTHGGHPYGSDESDKETLEIWLSKDSQYYKNAAYNWSVTDVKKREIAKKNNLVFYELWPKDNYFKFIQTLYDKQHRND